MLDQGSSGSCITTDPEDRPTGRTPLILMIAIMGAVELLLLLSDFGLLGPPRLRHSVFEYAGVWPGLLKGWKSNFDLQPYTMFLTYAIFHIGPLHLLINMVTLWSVGVPVLDRVGTKGFLIVYLLAILGGSGAHALLAPDLHRALGASGALFGLAGALLAWAYVDRYTYKLRLIPVAQAITVLILLNLIMWWAMDGQLAWETHLGGFIMGWVGALLVDPRPADLPPG